MKYSIIFCYRNREEHLNIVVPRIKETFAHLDHEIIIVEQNDNLKFRRASTLNEGAKVANGDILVFHDIDYYPKHVEYFNERSTVDVFLPVHRVEFVRNDMTPRPLEDTPSGYRSFRFGVDVDFFGGVISFRRDAFWKINGFNWRYEGWGFEDADLRARILHNKLNIERGYTNLFYALDHTDSCPPANDPEFMKNMMMYNNASALFSEGIKNQMADRLQITPRHKDVDTWIQVTNFRATV